MRKIKQIFLAKKFSKWFCIKFVEIKSELSGGWGGRMDLSKKITQPEIWINYTLIFFRKIAFLLR